MLIGRLWNEVADIPLLSSYKGGFGPIVQVIMGDRVYSSLLQWWIDRSYSKPCPFWHPLEGIFEEQVPRFFLIPTVMEIPTYTHSGFDVSMFYIIVKYRGRRYCIDKMLIF
jgi:hypothetical protein